MEIRELFGYKRKYWQDAYGNVWRRDPDGCLWQVSATGHPPRVRLYANGKEIRKYLHVIWRDTYPDRPEGPPLLLYSAVDEAEDDE